MHPVVQHLLKRKNKSVPINDGKKIVLVLYGGIMRGIRNAAGLVALEEMGLRQSFDEIYSFSIGAPNTAYFLSGQISKGLQVYYKDSIEGKMIKNGFIFKKVDLQPFLSLLKNKNHLDISKIFQQKTKFFVRVVNDQTKHREYLEAHEVGEENFVSLLEAPISPPAFKHGPVKIGNQMYTDTNFWPYLKEYLGGVVSSDATDIVVMYNSYYHRRKDYGGDPRILEICIDKGWVLSRFENNPEKLKSSAREMGRHVKKIFGKEEGINIL